MPEQSSPDEKGSVGAGRSAGIKATAGGTRALWSVVIVGFGVMFFSSSIKGVYQVYFRDLADTFGTGRGQFALTGALFGLCLGVVSPLVGTICDRHGPYLSMISGALVAALAFLLLGLIPNYPLFLFAYGILAAYALAAMTFVPMGVWIDNVFVEHHKGLAYAAVSNGIAIGFIVLSPLWVWFNGWLPWPVLATTIGIGFLLAVAVPLIWASRHLPVSQPANGSANVNSLPDSGIVSNLRRPLFLLLAVSFAGCGSSMAFIDMHFVPLMQERLALTGAEQPAVVALSLSVLGVFELAGALIVGYVADKTRPALLLAALYGVRGLILLMLAVTPSPIGFLAFSAVFGATYMGTVILTSLMCLQCYGTTIKGRMFGLLFTVHQLAVFGTAWLGGVARDLTGGYTVTTLGVAAFCMVSVVAATSLHGVIKRAPVPGIVHQKRRSAPTGAAPLAGSSGQGNV